MQMYLNIGHVSDRLRRCHGEYLRTRVNLFDDLARETAAIRAGRRTCNAHSRRRHALLLHNGVRWLHLLLSLQVLAGLIKIVRLRRRTGDGRVALNNTVQELEQVTQVRILVHVPTLQVRNSDLVELTDPLLGRCD